VQITSRTGGTSGAESAQCAGVPIRPCRDRRSTVTLEWHLGKAFRSLSYLPRKPLSSLHRSILSPSGAIWKTRGRFTRARRAAARRTTTDEEPHEHDAQTRDGDLVRLRSDGRVERGHPLSLTSAFGGHGGRSDHLTTPVGEAHAHQPSTDCSRVTRSTARPRSSGPCLSLGVGGPKHCLDIALVVCTV
jgi:hypothetical protein